MKYGIYSIRDMKTGFLPPTVDVNALSAMRNFEHACYNSDSLFFSHPEDYSLFALGTFDTDTGRICPDDNPTELVSAFQVKLKNEEKG